MTSRLFLAILLTLTLSACNRKDLREVIKEVAEDPADTTGMASETFSTNPFYTIEVNCFADVTFKQTAPGSASSVKIFAEPSVMPHVKVGTADGVLSLSTDRRYKMPEKSVIVAEIQAPFVGQFFISGGKCLRLGHIRLSSPLTLELDGVGALTAKRVEAPEVTVKGDGTGSVDLRGINTSRLTAHADNQCYIYLSGRTKAFTRTAGKSAIIFTDSLTVTH
ncbi:MAG: GIN domain-containing protein [Alloprevotella sp.]